MTERTHAGGQSLSQLVAQRLKAALWFAVGKIVDEESLRRNRNVTPQFIGALMEMVWTQIGTDSTCPGQHARLTPRQRAWPWISRASAGTLDGPPSPRMTSYCLRAVTRISTGSSRISWTGKGRPKPRAKQRADGGPLWAAGSEQSKYGHDFTPPIPYWGHQHQMPGTHQLQENSLSALGHNLVLSGTRTSGARHVFLAIPRYGYSRRSIRLLVTYTRRATRCNSVANTYGKIAGGR